MRKTKKRQGASYFGVLAAPELFDGRKAVARERFRSRVLAQQETNAAQVNERLRMLFWVMS